MSASVTQHGRMDEAAAAGSSSKVDTCDCISSSSNLSGVVIGGDEGMT